MSDDLTARDEDGAVEVTLAPGDIETARKLLDAIPGALLMEYPEGPILRFIPGPKQRDSSIRDVLSQFLADYTGWWEKKSDLDTPADDFGVDADELTERLEVAGYTIVTTDSAPAGICGDRAPTLPDQLIVCTLPAGHAGWHGNGRGTDWTGEAVPDAQ